MTEHEQPATQPAEMRIRWMIRRDMAEVLEIEGESFEFPWTEEDFIRHLRQRNCIGMVVDEGDQAGLDRITGFVIYELHANRLEVTNLAVRPSERRRGVGAALVRKLVGKLSANRRNKILLVVRETNVQAQTFFRRHGFLAVNVLKECYADTAEDGYLMQYRYRGAAIDTTKVTPAEIPPIAIGGLGEDAKPQAGEKSASRASAAKSKAELAEQHAGKIRPCPFCGGVVVATTLLSTGASWVVACGECFARGPVKKTKAEAVEVWNEVWFPKGAT